MNLKMLVDEKVKSIDESVKKGFYSLTNQPIDKWLYEIFLQMIINYAGTKTYKDYIGEFIDGIKEYSFPEIFNAIIKMNKDPISNCKSLFSHLLLQLKKIEEEAKVLKDSKRLRYIVERLKEIWLLPEDEKNLKEEKKLFDEYFNTH